MTAVNAKTIEQIIQSPRRAKRRIVAIAGPPASGKSTLAAKVVADLCQAGCASQLVPMDGFHLHNPILEGRNVLNKKGAPETFDIGGLLRLVAALGSGSDVYYPTFDRRRDIAIAGAGYVDPACDTVVVEGNYLLMDAPDWRDLAEFWDFTIMLDCPDTVLEERLVQRWLDYGLSPEQAKERAEENDLPNARLVNRSAMKADTIVRNG